MKEKSDNKSLVKVNDNIFSKIKKFILKLFKYDIKNDYTDIEEVIHNNQIDKSDDRNEFINQLKETENTDMNVFNLQRKYENGHFLKSSNLDTLVTSSFPYSISKVSFFRFSSFFIHLSTIFCVKK